MSGKIPADMVKDPELRLALTEACEKQFRGYLFGGEYVKSSSKDTIGETLEQIEAERKKLMEKHEGYMEQAKLAVQQARFTTDPVMRDITKNLERKHGFSGLICPVCGERDHGNKDRGKPVCYMNWKHNGLGSVLLVKPEEVEDWEPPKKKPTFKESWELDDDDIMKVRK